uniref:RING-type E3 ubiquitin transferase n=1 Tax=Meloidogyne hapla TaxID=6305 RepID=A0A1I8BWD3_MELHA
MYPACGQPQWSELLCCLKCKTAMNLGCGHLMCLRCTKAKNVMCPLDKSLVSSSAKFHYINGPVLAIISGQKRNEFDWLNDTLKSFNGKKGYNNLIEIESILYSLAEYLYKVNSEKGATVSSNRISRTIQRKLLLLLCANLLKEDGREQIMQTIRSMSERIISELVLHIQSNSNLSSSLWSAVRSRGCQFLGPGLQEDVLKLVRHALLNGESIARKTLVLFVVDTLIHDYPTISKTCVGHVVQLLYRASCFNVIKRDGQSSLMNLKEQFRDYDALRAEHDAQIVQIAMEAGLRISPDQWSSLLYESICDRLSQNSLPHAVEELRKLVNQQPKERDLFDIINIFGHFDGLSAFRNLGRERRLELASNENRQYNGDIQRSLQPFLNYRPPRLWSPAASIEVDCRPQPPPMPLMAQPPSLANYLVESAFTMPMGSPPNFISPPLAPPLNLSPNSLFPIGAMRCGEGNCLVGSPQRDSIENLPATFLPVLPVSQRIDSSDPLPVSNTPFILNQSSSPTLYNGSGPSIIVFGGNSNGEYNKLDNNSSTQTFSNQTITNNGTNGGVLFSSSPPTYHLGSNNLVQVPPSQFSIPIQQPQSLILYGSTPPNPFAFGSPPALFPHWVMQMETTSGNITGLFSFNNNNSTSGGITSAHCQQLDEPFELEEGGSRKSSDEKFRRRYPSRPISNALDEDENNAECHVAFTVATSVLSLSYPSSTTFSPSNSQLNSTQQQKLQTQQQPTLSNFLQTISKNKIPGNINENGRGGEEGSLYEPFSSDEDL